jgi:hypothetical protein
MYVSCGISSDTVLPIFTQWLSSPAGSTFSCHLSATAHGRMQFVEFPLVVHAVAVALTLCE